MRPSDPEGSQMESLREELAVTRRRKSEALERLKACAGKVAEGSPADSKTIRLYKKGEKPPQLAPTSSGTHEAVPDQAERLKFRRSQVAEARKARKNGLAALKQTTMRAVETFRETRLFDSDMKDRLNAPPSPNGA